jgi:RNA polymerase sigma factor (sigma-70 family)
MPQNDLSDEDLMRSLQKGDSASLIILYERHSDKIWAYLHKRVPREHIEDLLQDSFVKIVEKKDYWDNQPFLLWLYVVMRNIVMDFYRSEKIEKQMLTKLLNESSKMDRDNFEDLVSHIPSESSKLLIEYFKEGWSYKELAHRYDLTEVSLRKRLSRALGLLKGGKK